MLLAFLKLVLPLREGDPKDFEKITGTPDLVL